MAASVVPAALKASSISRTLGMAAVRAMLQSMLVCYRPLAALLGLVAFSALWAAWPRIAANKSSLDMPKL